MVLPNTFSRRKRAASKSADPLTYHSVPSKLRWQVLHILNEAIDLQTKETEGELYSHLCQFMRKEVAVGRLADGYSRAEEFANWFLSHNENDEVLDAVELVCRLIGILAKQASYSGRVDRIKDCIVEINARFLEAGVGYQFENGQLVQIDSKLAHKEIVVPALHLLADPAFGAAEHEFLDAFSAFREGDYETSLTEACKSLESTIKVIGAQKGWGLDETWPLRKLMQTVFDHNLIPAYMQSEFTGLRTILENGVGTVRNKDGGHGAGEKKRNVPRHVAAFQIHQTAAAILLLVEAANVRSRHSEP